MPRPTARSPSITSQESYSAVMITDVVAEVPVETEEEYEEQMKDETNLAYDAHLDGETTGPTHRSQKTNGAGISRGVILNAVQFGQNDSKTKSDEKPIQLTASLPVTAVNQPVSESKGFKDMSLLRKVAFGFSFLPSIIFVLCFAVILPCNLPKPCIREVWNIQLNNTELTQGLEDVSESILLTVLKQGVNVLLKLDKSNGALEEIKLPSRAVDLKCGKIFREDKTDCVVMDDAGKFYSFNDSHSKPLWNPFSEEGRQSLPVILSGCDDEMEDIAIAVSHSTIKIMQRGNKISNVGISDCDSVPIKLTPWAINDSLNIVFICEKNGEDRLVRIPKNVWCNNKQSPQEKPILLQSKALDSLKNSTFQPIQDGIVLWSEDEAFMIQPDGSNLWRVSNLSHPEENRYILYGRFHEESKQIALISSNLISGLKVTLLNPLNGSLIKTINHPNSEAADVIHVQGKKRDFAILLLKKIAQDTVSTALTQINDLSTTIVNLISNEEVAAPTQRPISIELALLDLDGGIETIMDLKGGIDNSAIKAISDKDSVLSIYFVSTSKHSQKTVTEARNIEVANWDKSTKSKCKV